MWLHTPCANFRRHRTDPFLGHPPCESSCRYSTHHSCYRSHSCRTLLEVATETEHRKRRTDLRQSSTLKSCCQTNRYRQKQNFQQKNRTLCAVFSSPFVLFRSCCQSFPASCWLRNHNNIIVRSDDSLTLASSRTNGAHNTDTLTISFSASKKWNRFSIWNIPRAASATRALLRLTPCHRIYLRPLKRTSGTPGSLELTGDYSR